MAITAVKPSARLLAFLMVTVLTGCGLTQTVKDGAVSVTQSIFYPQVKTLHLDLRAREGVNNNAKGASLATVVRIYSLRTGRRSTILTTRRCLLAMARRCRRTGWRKKMFACVRANR